MEFFSFYNILQAIQLLQVACISILFSACDIIVYYKAMPLQRDKRLAMKCEIYRIDELSPVVSWKERKLLQLASMSLYDKSIVIHNILQ
jgi:hypothetical protein